MTSLRTVFITGATGHIGRNVARAFRRAGYRVLGLARDAAKASGLAAEEIVPVLGTLQQPAAWRAAAASAEVLVHAAVDYAGDTMALDRAAVQALLQGAATRGATLIYTSGVWVHGDTAGRVVDETAPLAPIELVAPRVETERLVLGAPALRGIVIRPAIVYGRQGGLTAPWFGEHPVAGDGRNHWPLVHVDDLADAYVRCAERGSAGSAYIVADRSRATVGELRAAARRAAGIGGGPGWIALAEARRTMGPFADALALDQQVSAARAERELGWRARHAGFVAEAPILAAAIRARAEA
ncbi:MAG: NAD-dependent epimerase/dehydratase family protein [Rubrivivax sp.]|nr:NAD-dependent epimerase/dehydratase family protein [Rubrivivax sp.]